MAETKYISNTTSFSKSGSSIGIITEYDDQSYPNIVSSDIFNVIGNQDGVSYIEGQLVIQAKNMPSEIDVTLNGLGELVITGASCELKGYSIVDGYLIYKG